MKLKTNLFLGKKPSLEEGQMIYTVSDEDAAVKSTEKRRCFKFCIQLVRVIFYVLLLLFLLYLVWLGFLIAAKTVGSTEYSVRCGVVYDYLDSDRDFNSTEVDDMMIGHADDSSSHIDYANIDTMDDPVPTEGVGELMEYLDDTKTDDAKRITAEIANEFMKSENDYIKRILQHEIDEAEFPSTFPSTTSDSIQQ